MNLNIITWIIIIGVVVLLIIWDIIDKIEDPSGDSTISWQVWLEASRRPIIAVFPGIICGHLFGQQLELSVKVYPLIILWIVMIICVMLLIYWEIIEKASINTIITLNWWADICRRPLIGFLIGIPIGSLFWQTP
jgi:hypothetical protein